MGGLIIILLWAYFLTGLVRNLILIFDWATRRDAKEEAKETKYPNKKKLEE